MAIASSWSRLESWNRRTISPPFGQPRNLADGTEISSPLMGSRSRPRLSTIMVPQFGQASSGSARPRRALEALRLLSVFIAAIFVLMKRNHHAVVPQDHLYVEDRFGDLRLEEIHPLARHRRWHPSG